MKLVFDKEVSKERLYSNVIAIPTTTKEKKFFRFCKDANGNYKPWVYSELCDLGEQIIDNPMVDIYDNHGNFIHNSEIIMNMVHDAKQESDYAAIPKPSNLCILSLYYTLSKRYNKVRRVNLLYKKRMEMRLNQSVVVRKERKSENNDNTK
jgi:hypothetical protein